MSVRRIVSLLGAIFLAALVLTGCRAERPEPEMTVQLEQKGEGLQVRVETRGFVVPKDGHVHIWIDDGAETMAYSSVYTVPKLEKGKHKVKVALSDLQHRPLGVEQTHEVEIR